MLNGKLNKAQRNSRSTVTRKSVKSDFKRSELARAINQNLSLPKLCALTALTISSPSFAQSFPATIDLLELDGSDGFSITGEDYNGTSVNTAGDFNGDGITDILIMKPPPRDNPAGAYIVFGGEDVGSTGTLNITEFNGDDGILISRNSEFPGFSRFVSDADDFNDDGISDLIIGSSGAQDSFVVFGGADLGGAGVLPLATILDGTNGFIITGVNEGVFPLENLYSGNSRVSTAGDFNGDGISDIIVGNASSYYPSFQQSFIVFGGADVVNSNPLDVDTLDGSNGFLIKRNEDQTFLGTEVSDAGDFNGDGVADVIIGDTDADPNGIFGAGQSYIVFGGAGVGSSGSLELSSLDGANGFVINGIAQGDVSGRSVSAAGDFNGDGVADVIIGAPNANPNGPLPNGINRAGQSYIVFGGAGVGNSGSLELSSLDGTNGFVINGISEFDGLGASVQTAGDVNGDGFDDVIIGPSLNSSNSSGKRSYVVFGGAGVGNSGSLNLSSLNGTNGFSIGGVDPSFRAFAGTAGEDINNDGVSDVIINLDGYTRGPQPLGYVVFGRETTPTPTPTPPPTTLTCNGLPVTVNLALGQTPTAGDDVIRGTQGADTIRALTGNDTICGLGGDDLINAGGGDDWVDAGLGNDTVFGLGGADVLRGRVGDDRILGGDGIDLINGNGGADTLNGGSGDDLVFGGDSNDDLFGELGADMLFGGTGNDSITGGNGADDINGGAGSDVLTGSAGNDVINGGLGEDEIFGNGGNDTIIATDVASSGGNSDLVNGGAGVDNCLVDDIDRVLECP